VEIVCLKTICETLNHRKAEPSWMLPQNLPANLEFSAKI